MTRISLLTGRGVPRAGSSAPSRIMKGLVERPQILRLEVREADDQAGRRVHGGEVKAVTLHP